MDIGPQDVMAFSSGEIHLLKSSWQQAWSGITAKGDGQALMQALLSAYQEPQRKYHNVRHLSECLGLLQQYRSLAAAPAEVELALWFHDAIYDVTGHDNELRSAEWAVSALTDAGVAITRVEAIRQLILATRHSVLPQNSDEALLVDIDLAILGAAPARFQEYDADIRAEYAWVPEALFRQKRLEVLKGFLAREFIYSTPEIRAALEDQARSNLLEVSHSEVYAKAVDGSQAALE